MYSSSSTAEDVAEDDGSESISSASEELMAGSMKLSLLLIDMAHVFAVECVWADGDATGAACYRGLMNDCRVVTRRERRPQDAPSYVGSLEMTRKSRWVQPIREGEGLAPAPRLWLESLAITV